MFNKGDRVVAIKNVLDEDLFQAGVIDYISGNSIDAIVRVRFADGRMASYRKWKLVLEEVYNSPLFRAMSEED